MGDVTVTNSIIVGIIYAPYALALVNTIYLEVLGKQYKLNALVLLDKKRIMTVCDLLLIINNMRIETCTQTSIPLYNNNNNK